MKDKVVKIIAHIKKIAGGINPFLPDEDGKNSDYESGRMAMAMEILQYVVRLQEEPVSEKKCMFTKDSYTDVDRNVLCEDCQEECEFAKKEKFFDPISLVHKWDNEFDELLEPYKDSRNYKNLYIRLRYWKQNCKREFLWKYKYKNEEHVNEELEKELKSYLERVKATDKDIDFIDFSRHFARWQKQQMMKGAVEAEVEGISKSVLNGSWGYFKVEGNYKNGDKVRVIIIKDE